MRSVALHLLCITAVLSLVTPAMAGGKVLLVHSYHTGYPWVDSITAGVEKGLKGSGVSLEIFYMDTKRKTSAEWKVESGNLAKAKVEEFQPDVVITADDNAQAFFAKDYAGKADAPQFVFCGVNAEAAKYGYPAENVTGILERPHFAQTLKMLLGISGDIKKIALLTDHSPTSDAVLGYLKTLESPLEIVSIDQPATIAEWQEVVTRYQSTVDAFGVYNYHTVASVKGAESMEAKEVMAWTVANNGKPTFGLLPFGVEDGLLCGVVESGEDHGLESAKLALQILDGNKAGDYPIKTAEEGAVLLNVATAEKMNLEIPYELVETADRVIEK